MRLGSAADAPAICELLGLARQEVPAGRWSEKRVAATVAECLETGGVILSLSHDKPVGTLGFVPATFWWSDDPLLQEKWVFVHPQHRRAPHARAMLRLIKDIQRRAGMPLLIGVMSAIRTQGKIGLFRSEFGEPAGASFLVNG